MLFPPNPDSIDIADSGNLEAMPEAMVDTTAEAMAEATAMAEAMNGQKDRQPSMY